MAFNQISSNMSSSSYSFDSSRSMTIGGTGKLNNLPAVGAGGGEGNDRLVVGVDFGTTYSGLVPRTLLRRAV